MTGYYLISEEETENMGNPHNITDDYERAIFDLGKQAILSKAQKVDLDEAARRWEQRNRTYDSDGKMRFIEFSDFLKREKDYLS